MKSPDESGLFTYPWPGPGNSEGPVDPEGWLPVHEAERGTISELAESLVATTAWPGPGDSEA
jgi:hypothetical protein